MTYSSSGHKTFEVLSEQGLSLIRQKVLRRMLEAEEGASRVEMLAHKQITPLNYELQILDSERQPCRLAYVLEATTTSVSRFSLRGRIWLDSEEFAVVRVEATPQ
jgi:outer membrane lipoprotein-sorting protein